MPVIAPLWPDAPRLAPAVALPSYRFVPDETPHPRRDPRGHSHGAPMPAPGLPPDAWRSDVSYLLGIDLYHQGYLWEAHEAWEAGFFAARDRPEHRRFLQALVQIAAASLQARRGRGAGVRLLVGAATAKLAALTSKLGRGERFCGIDVAALLADVDRHFAPALGDDLPGDRNELDAAASRTVGPPPRLEVSP
ncbi:MAG: DUF309 domain-containing protein [Planctomycetes bacterium]|nr:DUF309 domain-containing protein [Planctomycetota bacterium]